MIAFLLINIVSAPLCFKFEYMIYALLTEPQSSRKINKVEPYLDIHKALGHTSY